MPGLSKVIVLDPDARAGRQVQLGFRREGVPVEVAEVPRDPAELALPTEDTGLVVVGGTDPGALELVRQARKLLGDAAADVPIVFAGRGVRRTDVETAGADEVMLAPAYLRDVVTIGRLLHGQPATHRAHLVGSLVETTGVLTLVRALAALGRSAVLTLIRGLRRGEVRFYHGEVTSAQVGMIYGQAALHQLLLWTDARFDFHHEDIVRRHQIPLERDELFADAERFLTGVRESSGKLSPSMVLEQDAARLQALGKKVPTEVHGVLRMFDGHRVLADVLEDSPYRVFETLRVAQLAVEAGLLREAAGPRPRATWRAVLALEEWLVGAETRDEILERHAGGDGAPVPRPAADAPSGRTSSGPHRSKGSRKKRKKRRANTPVPATPATPAAAAKPEIDWGSLVPRVLGAEVGPLACVVPASHISGEITLPPRPMAPREQLEALTDSAERDRIFPAEEPSVVWNEAAELERQERERAEAAAKAEAEARVAREAAELASRLAEARATTEMPPLEGAAPAPAGEDAGEALDRARRDAEETAELEAMYRADVEAAAEAARAAAEPVRQLALDLAAPVAPAEVAVTRPIRTPKAGPPAEAPATAPMGAATAEETVPVEELVPVEPATEPRRTEPMPTVAEPPESSRTRRTVRMRSVALQAEADHAAPAEADHAAPVEAAPTEPAEPRRTEPMPTVAVAAEPRGTVPAEAARTVPMRAVAAPAEADPADADRTVPMRAVPVPAEPAEAARGTVPMPTVAVPAEARDTEPAGAPRDTEPMPPLAVPAEAKHTEPMPTIAVPAEPAQAKRTLPMPTVAERAAAEPTEPDTPAVLVEPPPAASAEPPPAASAEPAEPASAIVSGELGAPRVAARTADEPALLGDAPREAAPPRPSDQMPAIVIEAAPPELPPVIVDLPPAELERAAAPLDEAFDEPSDGVIRQAISTAETAPTSRRPPGTIPVDDRPEDTTGEIVTRTGPRPAVEPPTLAEPSILVTDLAEVHTAVAAVAAAQASAPPTPSMATPAAERAVAEVSDDAAVAFTDLEEDFFRAGQDRTGKMPAVHVDSFDDLDEGYRPVGFWDRLLGRKPRR